MVLGFYKNRIIIDIPKYFLYYLLFSRILREFYSFVVDSEAIIKALEQFYFVYDKRNNSLANDPATWARSAPLLGFSLQKYIDFVETGNEWDIDN